MVQEARRCVQGFLPVEEVIINFEVRLTSPRLGLTDVRVIFEVGNETLAIRVLEIEYIILILLIVLDANRLYSVLLPYNIASLPILLLLLLPLLNSLPLLPPLPLKALLFLYARGARLLILLFILEGSCSRFKSTTTVFLLA